VILGFHFWGLVVRGIGLEAKAVFKVFLKLSSKVLLVPPVKVNLKSIEAVKIFRRRLFFYYRREYIIMDLP